MSRNLTETHCDFCGGFVFCTEEPRRITKEDAKLYFDQYEGMMVAKAVCVDCLARYLAWIKVIRRSIWITRPVFETDWYVNDLSFRSTFNDEPGPDDMPRENKFLRKLLF